MHRDEWFYRIKTATRALVKFIGTQDDAGAVAQVSQSQIQRWVDPRQPDLITLSAAMKLEAETGMSCITEVMAAQNGHHLVNADGTRVPSCVVTGFAGVADEFGDLATRVAEALADGTISPNEHTAISDALASLAQAVAKAQGASGRIRAVAGERS